ncbi:MAG: hypothetical protein NTX64_10775, partial [Elusimicrobia bacterium]|nr:hypothetical protein [Elusimicrobiota bacterium]
MILAAELRAALAQRCVAGAALCLVVAASLLAPASPGPVWWLALAALPWILALVWPPETPWRPAFAAWTAWIAWGGVCALASREPWLSLAGWWRQASVFGTLVLAAAWWSRRERRWWGMGFTTLALAGTAALAARPGATAPTWGAAAELWAPIGAAVAAGWLSGGEREGVRRFLWAALLIGAAGVGWAGSWPARIALATCALLCLAFASRRAAGAALLLAVGAATAAARANGAAWHPAPFWSDALAVLSAHPVTGVGPRLLERELARLHGAPLPAGGSLLLRVGAESGWPGLVLFAAAALGSVPRGFRRFDGPGRAAAALLAALAAYAVVGDPSGSPGFFVA